MSKRSKFSILLAGLALVAFSAVPAAFADSGADAGSYAGVLLGPSFVNQGLGTQFAIGGHVGTKLSPIFGLGFYGTYESLGSGSASDGVNSVSASLSEVILAAEPNFFVLGDDSLYVGAKIGVGLTSGSLSANINGVSASGSGTQTNFAVGPAVGYNLKLNPNWSVNAEVNSIWVTTSGSALNLTNILFGASYWF